MATTTPPDAPKYGYLPVGTGLAVILLPVGASFWLAISLLRVMIHAIPWLTLWGAGYLMCGGAAQLLRLISGSGTAGTTWAVGGAFGILLMSMSHGLTTASWFWAARHRMSPYQADYEYRSSSGDPPHTLSGWLVCAAVVGTTLAGICPALLLVTREWGGSGADAVAFWPHLWRWTVVGGCGLALEGFIMGIVLGNWQSRPELDLANRSFGEAIGSLIAGSRDKIPGALGWGIGYALHQAPVGAIAGLGTGLLTHLVG